MVAIEILSCLLLASFATALVTGFISLCYSCSSYMKRDPWPFDFDINFP